MSVNDGFIVRVILGALQPIYKAMDFLRLNDVIHDQNCIDIPPEILQFVGFTDESQVSIPPLTLIDVWLSPCLLTR